MRHIFIFILALGSLAASAQRDRQNEHHNDGNVLLINLLYGIHLPGGDLADRFGKSSSLGGSFQLLTKGIWLAGLSSHFHFGQEVKTDVIATVRDDEGNIFGDERGIAEVQLRERGLWVGAELGRVFSMIEAPGNRSGIQATVGAGIFQHKIRIQDDPAVVVSQLGDDYKKGYDRLSNGLALTQFLGWRHLSANRRINFLAGLEFMQAFTQNRRSFDFDTRQRDTAKRLDLLYGFRIGWTLPLYVGENPDEIRY